MTDNNKPSKASNAWIAIDHGLSADPKLEPYPIATERRGTYALSPAPVIFNFLNSRPGRHAKSDMLIANGKVERQGKKRGAVIGQLLKG
jgi:hypothetical protein